MADLTLLDLLKAGVHFGHQVGRWHPKMKPYIFGTRGGVAIIDLEKTLEFLHRALTFVRDVAARGGTILFIGTKRQAQDIIRTAAERVGQPYVVERWIGGTFTNYETIGRLIRTFRDHQEGLKTGAFDKYTKKERLAIEKETEKLATVVGGIAAMKALPDAVYVVDGKQERIALREAKKVGVPVVALVDTNVNPEGIAYPIPANDDAMKSIELLTGLIADSIAEGQRDRQARLASEAATAAAGEPAGAAAPPEVLAVPPPVTEETAA